MPGSGIGERDWRGLWGTPECAADVASEPPGLARGGAAGQWTLPSITRRGPNGLGSMAGLNANNVLFSTGAGALVRWNRTTGFSVLDPGAQIGAILLARSERDLWANGIAGRRHWNGSAWSTVEIPRSMEGVSSLDDGEGGEM